MKNNKGFTLIEVVVVFGIIIALAGIVLASSFNFRTSTEINSVINKLITEIKNQQIKAMTGDTEGSLQIDNFGIYFFETKYTLFHGDTFSLSDPSNFDINMESDIKIRNSFPNNTIIFAPGSGEIVPFIDGSNTITINDVNNFLSKTIQLNKYGSVINLNDN